MVEVGGMGEVLSRERADTELSTGGGVLIIT